MKCDCCWGYFDESDVYEFPKSDWGRCFDCINDLDDEEIKDYQDWCKETGAYCVVED